MNVIYCNENGEKRIVKCGNNEICIQGACDHQGEECFSGNGWTFFRINGYGYNLTNLEDSCSLLNDTWTGELECDNEKIDKSSCKVESNTIPLDNEKALISGEELKNGNYIITVNYTNGKTVEKTYTDTKGISRTEQYCPSNNVKYDVKIEFKHFPFWKMFNHHKRIEWEITPDNYECKEELMCNDGYACSKEINGISPVDKICPQGKYCYKIITSTLCKNSADKCDQYTTNGGNLLIKSFEPKHEGMFITYDQVKEYCCNTGNNDIIEIPSGQKWTPKKNNYNRINFKIKQKGYEPYRIKVESKTPNGWYVHKLSDTKYHCDNGNCYYLVMDNKLVGGRKTRNSNYNS